MLTMLCKEVQDYLASVKGLPFFYVVGDSSYQAALKEFQSNGISVIRISDLCYKEDKFPSVDDLIDYFRTSDVDYRDNKFVVVGLGEFLALKGNMVADYELRRLKNTTLGNARVVLLLRGITAEVNKLLSEDGRIQEQRRAYVSDNTFSNISITNIQVGDGIVEKKGIKYLLAALEDGATNNVVVNSQLILNDSCFPVATLSSSYDVIKMLLPNIVFQERHGSEEHFDRLLKELNKCENDLNAVFDKYGVDDSVFDDMYEAVSGLEYRNWIVYIYMLQKFEVIKNSYLKLVLEKTGSFEDLKNNILTCIIDISHNDTCYMDYYFERKRLIKNFPEEEIAHFIKMNEMDPEESIYKLTDNTIIERKTVVKWIASHGIPEVLHYIYPDLSDYLKKYVFEGVLAEELTDYFDEYKKLKITNQITQDFILKVENNAKSLSYAKLPTRNNAILGVQNKNDAYLYWIDALGVEYLSYFVSLAKKKGLSIKIEVTRSDLPTITSINKQFFEQWNGGRKYKEEQLDNIKHKEKGGYYFTDDSDPIHIVSELLVIEKAVSTAATELAMHKCKSFIIASDHGASRLAVIHKQEIPYETDTKGEHSGRCCKAFEDCQVTNKVEENGYIVLSDYGRFKKSRAANVEVHGGASLEEIVVPVITLTLKKHGGVIIKVLNPDSIIADRHQGVELSLYISEVNCRDNVSVVVDGEKCIGNARDDSHYVFKLASIKRSRTKPYVAEVFDGADLIGSIEFRVKGKAATIDNSFDDDFKDFD